jgi:[NiFe] hydrogenase diaphorase moiety large subunit
VQKGYKDQPTSVNNVETLCCAARILEKGAQWFSAIGTKDSTGTKLLSVSGDCAAPGVYEVPYGITVDQLLSMVGAVNAQGVQMGGPSGQCLAPKDFGRGISFEDLPTGGSVIVFGADRDLLGCMRQFVEFFVDESCGWCAPCRVGSTLLLKTLDKVLAGNGAKQDIDDLKRIGETMKVMSRCGLGQTAANPVLTTLRNFSGLYEAKTKPVDYIPSFDLAAALKEACAITGQRPHLEEEHV